VCMLDFVRPRTRICDREGSEALTTLGLVLGAVLVKLAAFASIAVLRADRTFAQACVERACKEQIRAHEGLVDMGFVDVDFNAGYVCGNMHNAQGKACAGGLYVDHPVYCCVVQVGSRCD